MDLIDIILLGGLIDGTCGDDGPSAFGRHPAYQKRCAIVMLVTVGVCIGLAVLAWYLISG